MLFHFTCRPRTLRHALRAAVASHRADVLRDIVGQRDDRCVASALSRCPARILDDALSMLPSDRRNAIAHLLPRGARDGLPRRA
jgi:hypothetical protein